MQPARDAIIRPAAAERSAADRPIDAGLRAPVTARRSFVIVRVVALGLSALTFPIVHPGRGWVVGLGLAICAILQPFIVRTVRHHRIVWYQALTDLHAAVLVAALEPHFLPIATMWIGVSLTWLMVATTRRASIAIGLLAVVEFAMVGAAVSFELWWALALAIGSALLLISMVVETLRTEMWAAESALVDALSAAGAVVHHSNLDDGTVTRVEGELHAITGWTAEQWYSASHRNFIHPDDIEQYWIDVDRITPDTVVDRVARIRHANGSWVWMRDIARIGVDRDGRRSLRGFSLDVTELETAQRRLATQARIDLLTNLPNRWALAERIEELAAGDEPFALLVLDVDRFKEVNDTLGHEAGDQLLTLMAERLGELAGATDMIARLGGDEFAIVVAGAAGADDIAEILAELSAESRRPFAIRDMRIAVSVSVGVALSATSGRDCPTLLRHADIAMYDAKRQAVAHRVFDDSLEQSSTMQLSLSAALPDAIESGRLLLHFQPKFDLATRRIVGAEGLARWDHPEFGLLSPAAFLDLVLVSESNFDFAVRTITHTVDMIRGLAEQGFDVPIAANVALGALRTVDFADRVLEILDRSGVCPSRLVIELTENDIQLPSPKMLSALGRLTEAGVDVSIDDFGTGHSSLERLRTMRVDELKIDRSFVNGMTASSVERELVRSVIDLGHSLGYGLVAEGVETEEQAAALLEMGCPVAQGYLFARPLPPAEFAALVVADAAEHGAEPVVGDLAATASMIMSDR